jgi:hypothetical protein
MERLVSAVYKNFCLSPKRTHELGEFQTLLGLQTHRILKAASTRQVRHHASHGCS